MAHSTCGLINFGFERQVQDHQYKLTAFVAIDFGNTSSVSRLFFWFRGPGYRAWGPRHL